MPDQSYGEKRILIKWHPFQLLLPIPWDIKAIGCLDTDVGNVHGYTCL